MKIYNVPMDEFTKELVLTALMDAAHKKGISIEAKNNYLTAYSDIKESIVNQ